MVVQELNYAAYDRSPDDHDGDPAGPPAVYSPGGNEQQEPGDEGWDKEHRRSTRPRQPSGSRPTAIKCEIPKPNRTRREDRTHEQDQGCLSRIFSRSGKHAGKSGSSGESVHDLN